MSKKAEAFLKFVQAASSLAKQGVKKSEILKFAKLQFGKVTDEITKAVDNIFEKSPLEKILDRRKAAKKSIEERKVLDMDGNVIDPNEPIIGGKQDKGITTLEKEFAPELNPDYLKLKKKFETEFTPEQAAEDIFPSGDYKYDMDMAAESYVENNPGMFKNMLYEDLDQKTQMEVYEKVSKVIGRKNAEKIKAKKANPESTKKGFQLNVEKFVQDFPVSKEEAVRISKLPTDEQQKIIQTYLDDDFKQQVTLMDFEIPKDRKPNATGGRAGFYMGGQSGQSVIEPDLSDIGHGSDALMSRTRLSAPGSQATTSTGLNYLLGEDNDNTRIPFNDGLLVPKPKPYTEEMFQDDSMTLLKGMYGTGKDSNEFLYNEMIKKGNMLRKQGVDRETVIEIIRNNKDKINAFLETQTTSPKTFKGMADGGRIGYATKGKVDLADLEALKGLKRARGEVDLNTPQGIMDQASPQRGLSAARSQRNKILDKAIAKFTYAVDNLDQETASYVKSLFNEKLKIGYETTMSGLKQDAFAKTGVVPIDKETIYNTIINLDLPKELKLEMEASSNTAGEEELAFSLINNNLGITYDNQSQTIVGKYNFDSKDGKLSITPSIQKNEDSEIQSRIEFDKAIKGGKIDLDVEKDTTDNSLTTDFSLVKDGNKLEGTNVSGTDNNYMEAEGTAEVPLYMLKDGEKPYISSNYYKDDNYDSLQSSIGLPITKNLEASLSNRSSSDGTNTNQLGVNYKKYINNIFTKNRTKDNRGIVSFDANIDSDKNRFAGINFSFPLGNNTTNNIGNMNFDDMYLSRDEKERLERKKLENTMFYNGKAYKKDNIYSGNELSGLIKGTKENLNLSDFIGPVQELASGGIAGLRQGYSKGKGVDLARRGFLKVLGGTVGAIAAFKSGALKLLGKTATTKAVPQVVKIAEGSGAPAWFEPMVNKVLADGLDITKKNATMDGQIVKSLDTPTGKVEVNYDTRSGNVDVNYSGENTAMGEGVDMRYVVGQADETTKGVKPLDEFEAVESIPEGQMYSPDDYQVEFGENATGNVKDLYSDTSELSTLGGQNPLIKDISNSIKKKQTLKKMNENPDQFASDNLPDYDPT